MRIDLASVSAAGDEIEICEYFADHRHVSWDEHSSLKIDLGALVNHARKHAEETSLAPMVLDELSFERVGPIKGIRYYFFTAHFQHEDGAGEPVMLVMDLRGKLVESETLMHRAEHPSEARSSDGG